MEDDEANTPDITGLRAIVNKFIWQADLGLKKQDRLSTHDAAVLRCARESLPADLRRLQEALLKISPIAATEAFEIEQCVAHLLRNADLICYLLPIPTPNVRDAVGVETGKRMRKRKAKKPRATALNQECEAEFIRWVKTLPADWDGKKGAWKEAGRVEGKINATLKGLGFEKMTQRGIWEHFRNLSQERRKRMSYTL